jgi:hypothetical protein
MCGCRDVSYTVFLGVVLGGALLMPAFDAWVQLLLFALASSFASDLLIPLVATGYVAPEHFSWRLDPQASDVGSRAPPTLSIS